MKSITPRIIKFRVWDGEKMIYPSIVGLPPYENFAWEHSRSYLHNCQYWDGEDGFVLEPTLMQFTGLHDKAGNEIYEGDIVKCHDHPTGVDDTIGVVEFERGYYKVNGHALHDYGTAWTEKIGNLFSNPELLNTSTLK